MFVSTEFCLATSIKQQDQVPQTFKEWVQFFLNAKLPKSLKTKYATFLLSKLTKNLDISHLSWLNHPELTQQHFAQQHLKVCEAFKAYLIRRKELHPREYFPTVSHAFEFLYQVAPTKLVDGAWLYSTLNQSHHSDFRHLIQIYLEELGLGNAQANHVTMYRHLLEHYELKPYTEYLTDDYYEQAAVQLALAYAPTELLPMVVGFNLGYEQLPLHLLITNYELAELGIDSQYFNVHITIDNAHNGHAEKSLQALHQLLQQSNDPDLFLTQVKQGFLLNDLGQSSTAIIQNLNPKNQVIQILKSKAIIGQHIHNEKCQFNGQSINEWLSQPEQIEIFLDVLLQKSWIMLNEPVEQSRFWALIHQPNGKMFGVFNATEKQFIKDWIQGERFAQRISPQSVQSNEPLSPTTFKQLEILKKELEHCPNDKARLMQLIPYLAPHCHDRTLGLWATQQFSKLLFPFQTLMI